MLHTGRQSIPPAWPPRCSHCVSATTETDESSWVPDFSTRWGDDFNIVTAIEPMGKAAEDTAYRSLFCASKGSSPKIFSFEKRGQHQLLCIAGVKFDSIKNIASAYSRSTFGALKSPDSTQEALLAQMREAQTLLPVNHADSSNSMETTLRVLMKDMEFGTRAEDRVLHRLPPTTLKTYVPYVTLLQQFRPISAFAATGFYDKSFSFFII
jgi:hypothetical protein